MLFCLLSAFKNTEKLFIQTTGCKVMLFSMSTINCSLSTTSSAMAAVTDVTDVVDA